MLHTGTAAAMLVLGTVRHALLASEQSASWCSAKSTRTFKHDRTRHFMVYPVSCSVWQRRCYFQIRMISRPVLTVYRPVRNTSWASLPVYKDAQELVNLCLQCCMILSNVHRKGPLDVACCVRSGTPRAKHVSAEGTKSIAMRSSHASL